MGASNQYFQPCCNDATIRRAGLFGLQGRDQCHDSIVGKIGGGRWRDRQCRLPWHDPQFDPGRTVSRGR